MRIVLIPTLLLWTICLQAQNNPYLADLNQLRSTLQKTPSYKAQIKGDKLREFNALYDRLASDTTGMNDFKCFYNLSQLIFPLRDNHLAFYQTPNYTNFKDKETIARFVATKEFADYPKYHIDIDSLKKELEKKPTGSIEGIYHYDKFYSVGLFKSHDKEYIGVVLESDINLWQKRQIAIRLYEYEPNLYKAIYGHPLTKNFVLEASEKYVNRSLINSYFYGSYSQSVYSKQPGQADHSNLPKPSPLFKLESINNDIQYLLVRTFQANNVAMKESARFYDSIKNLLHAPNLVLDLRDNQGGAKKESKKYYDLVKEVAKKGHVYVVVNNGTLSQAEIFILSLKKLKNITIVGQTTKGMLAYGSNSDKRQKLPSQKFEIYITDMKGSAERLLYEDHGITPDTFLNIDSDWIDQVVEIIKRRNGQ